MSDQALRRITRELHSIQQSHDLSIRVEYQDQNLLGPKAIIVGPPDTPYQFGFFEFSVKFPRDYPDKAPTVMALTTNSGSTRFNPNIYANGKVCLSILGTWRGEPGEQWSSAQGLESIMISIQSLMSSNPYENEPGFEKKSTPSDDKNKEAYVAKIKHETLRLAVIRPLEFYLGIYSDGTVATPEARTTEAGETEEDSHQQRSQPWEPFRDFVKRRFLWYYESYLTTINEEVKKHHSGTRFKSMPFEHKSNGMEGTFEYVELRRRLLLIRKVLDQETLRWAEEGRLAARLEQPAAGQMRLQFEQVRNIYKNQSALQVDISLDDDKNPFVWVLTYFGRPFTNFDSGMLRLRFAISPRFPEEWPRALLEVPIFHQRVTKDGIIAYLPRRYGELPSHIEALIAAIEEEEPPYDPRLVVNPDASKLFWGSEDDRKEYRKRLRKSVLRAMEM